MGRRGWRARGSSLAALVAVVWLSWVPKAAAQEAVLLIETVPAVAGVEVGVDGSSINTDSHGLMLASVPPGRHRLEAPGSVDLGEDARLRFERWSDGHTTRSRSVDVESFEYIEAGYETYHRVTFGFEGLGGEVGTVILEDNTGRRVALPGPGTVWLKATRLVESTAGFDSERLDYRVVALTVDGRSVEPPSEVGVGPSPGTELRLVVSSGAVPTLEVAAPTIEVAAPDPEEAAIGFSPSPQVPEWVPIAAVAGAALALLSSVSLWWLGRRPQAAPSQAMGSTRPRSAIPLSPWPPSMEREQAGERAEAALEYARVFEGSHGVLVDLPTSGGQVLSRELSAQRTSTPALPWFLSVGAVSLGTGILLAPVGFFVSVLAFVTFLYFVSLTYRVILFIVSLRSDVMIRVSDEQAEAVLQGELPTYTVLVPMRAEPEVAEQLLQALEDLRYPRNLLDVRILLEEDDQVTRDALLDCSPPSYVTIVTVPEGSPKTKPRALNYGVVGSKGELLTIYDAEDRPDPLQLVRAVSAFEAADPDVACLQARLSFYNPDQNLLTRWFTIEYGMWFALLLPGLVRLGAPLPLGGTSLHIRRWVIDEVGRWDAFNVTEDADLGVRLARFGYRTLVLDSVTNEEANSDFVNWIRQRSRWYKGYLQTWFVHMRHPRELYTELGGAGFLGFNLFVAGTPFLTVLNPFVWALSLLWFVAEPQFIPSLFPGWVFVMALTCWVIGNAAFIYASIVTVSVTGHPNLLVAALLTPIYWVIMSVAAAKAFWQLVTAPSFWEKTVHGLSPSAAAETKE